MLRLVVKWNVLEALFMASGVLSLTIMVSVMCPALSKTVVGEDFVTLAATGLIVASFVELACATLLMKFDGWRVKHIYLMLGTTVAALMTASICLLHGAV